MIDQINENLFHSWKERLLEAHNKTPHRKNIVDDGFYSHLARNATFKNFFEFPDLKRPKLIDIPEGAVPFSCMNKGNPNDCVVFFEKDPLFADALVAADDFIDELRKHKFVSSPDCSLYRDEPLAVQLANTYLNRLVGHYFQEKGLTLIPTVRWGDERSYTTEVFPEPFAFAGLPKKSVYWIGSYGVSQNKENAYHLQAGLEGLINYLTPKMILVYGSMPKKIFSDYLSYTNFVHFADWTSRCHGRG